MMLPSDIPECIAEHDQWKIIDDGGLGKCNSGTEMLEMVMNS